MKSLVGLVLLGCAANAPVVHPPAQHDPGSALGTALGHAGFSCDADDALQQATCTGIDGWPVYITFDAGRWTMTSYESLAQCFDAHLDSDGFSVKCDAQTQSFSFESSFVAAPNTDYAARLRDHLDRRIHSVASLKSMHAVASR